MNLKEMEKLLAAAQGELKTKEKTLSRAEQQAARDARWKEELKRQKTEENEPVGFSLEPVRQFYLHVKKEPREILEARYVAMLDGPHPLEARHDWLAVAVAYHHQIKFYQAHGRGVPTTVAMRANSHAFAWPHGSFLRPHDADDPTWSTDPEIWDDTFVVAATKNPWDRGAAKMIYFAVEVAGADGLAFSPLCDTIAEVRQCATPAAQEMAYEYFTKHVREGLTRIRIAQDEVS